MLKLLLLALIPIVLCQSTVDPCSPSPCRSDELCVKSGSATGFLCLDASSLQSLIDRLPTFRSVQQPVQQQLPQSRLSILPTTDVLPVQPVKPVLERPVSVPAPVTPNTSVPLPTQNLRMGNFVTSAGKAARVLRPSQSQSQSQQFSSPRVQSTQTQFRNFGVARDEVTVPTPAPFVPQPAPFVPQPAPFVPQPSPAVDTRTLCQGLLPDATIAFPFDNSRFVICHQDGSGSVLSCPPGLRFNSFRARCDYTDARPPLACDSNPCLNNGRCVDTPSFNFRCECTNMWDGETCEKVRNPCSSNPCGPRGECRTFGFVTPTIQHYCLCDGEQRYGLDCNLRAESNPCGGVTGEAFFPVGFSKSVFIHCWDTRVHLKACNDNLVWDQQWGHCV